MNEQSGVELDNLATRPCIQFTTPADHSIFISVAHASTQFKYNKVVCIQYERKRIVCLTTTLHKHLLLTMVLWLISLTTFSMKDDQI